MRLLGHPAVTFVLIRVGFLLGTALTLVWVIPSNTAVLAFGAYGRFTDYIFCAFGQWDSDWYLGIAENGYTETSAAFFPLFPGAAYVLGWVLGSNLVAGVLISLAGGAVGAWALHQIARSVIGDEAARDTVLLLALYPTVMLLSIFLSPRLSALPLAAAMFVGNLCSVAFLQYVAMKPVNRALHFWLLPDPATRARANVLGTLLVIACYAVFISVFVAVTR